MGALQSWAIQNGLGLAWLEQAGGGVGGLCDSCKLKGSHGSRVLVLQLVVLNLRIVVVVVVVVYVTCC